MNFLEGFNSDDIAISFKEKEITFGELKELSFEIEKKISSNFLKGDRVLVSSQNPITFIATLFACNRAKIVLCCWDGISSKRELIKLINASGYIVHHTEKIISIFKCNTTRNEVINNGDLIITTSGSTGKPKGVLLNLQYVIENAKLAGEKILFGNFDLSRWCIDIDFSLMSALNHLFMAWQFGVPLKIITGLNTACLMKTFTNQKNGFGGAPLQLIKLSQIIDRFAEGSLMVSSGDFLSKAIIKDIKSKHIGLSMASFYGLTELSGRFCYMSDYDLTIKPGAAGKPIEKETIFISKQNVTTQSRFLYEGYFKTGENFEKKKVPFNTGDIGFYDEDGYLWLEGRLVDTFKVSGLKVNRKEIELTLKCILADFNYIILPVKHNLIGTCCALFVENNFSKNKPPLKEIIAVIKDKHFSSCIPVYSYLLKNMPLLSNGKLNKQFMMENHFNYEKYR